MCFRQSSIDFLIKNNENKISLFHILFSVNHFYIYINFQKYTITSYVCKIVHTKHFIQITLPLNVASEEHILHLCRTGAVGATAGRLLEPEGIGDAAGGNEEGCGGRSC